MRATAVGAAVGAVAWFVLSIVALIERDTEAFFGSATLSLCLLLLCMTFAILDELERGNRGRDL